MQFFQFEADFVDSLNCIPMQIRYKLDTCGVKLKLVHWNHFTQDERQTLLDLPCDGNETAEQYRTYLQQLVIKHTGQPAGELDISSTPPWLDGDSIPADLQHKAQNEGIQLTVEQWRSLSPLQRFALIKLSRPSHENRNFIPALREFALL